MDSIVGLGDEEFTNTPEESAQLTELVRLGVDITRPLHEQAARQQAAYRRYVELLAMLEAD